MDFNLISVVFLFMFLFCEVIRRLAKSLQIQAWTELDAKIWPNSRRSGQTDPAPTAKLPKICPIPGDLKFLAGLACALASAGKIWPIFRRLACILRGFRSLRLGGQE